MGIDVDPNLIRLAADRCTKSQIAYRACDVTENISVIEDFLRDEGIAQFDVIFCFSVSMWIHLNKGHAGLVRLFERCRQLCRHFLLLEPQPWKCYMTAARRMRKLKQPKFDHLEDIEERQDRLLPYIMRMVEKEGDFTLRSQLGQTNWDRQILLYQKNNLSLPSHSND